MKTIPKQTKINQTEVRVVAINNLGIRACRQVQRDLGVSDITIWRWQKLGWIKTVNISSKKYVDMDSLENFVKSAKAGKFFQLPAGAALDSLKK